MKFLSFLNPLLTASATWSGITFSFRCLSGVYELRGVSGIRIELGVRKHSAIHNLLCVLERAGLFWGSCDCTNSIFYLLGIEILQEVELRGHIYGSVFCHPHSAETLVSHSCVAPNFSCRGCSHPVVLWSRWNGAVCMWLLWDYPINMTRRPICNYY